MLEPTNWVIQYQHTVSSENVLKGRPIENLKYMNVIVFDKYQNKRNLLET